jgi:hypothetical protein
MYARAKVVLTSLLVLLLPGSIALAQEYAPAPGRPAFAQQQLDQMLAPIALYPDALLSQILMASTYPIEIVEAARWSRRECAQSQCARTRRPPGNGSRRQHSSGIATVT